MLFIAHVFENRSDLTRHLNNVFCEDIAISADKQRRSYLARNNKRHLCFVVAEREDINALVGIEFSSYEVHGDFEELSKEDKAHMLAMLEQCTRPVPESANG